MEDRHIRSDASATGVIASIGGAHSDALVAASISRVRAVELAQEEQNRETTSTLS